MIEIAPTDIKNTTVAVVVFLLIALVLAGIAVRVYQRTGGELKKNLILSALYSFIGLALVGAVFSGYEAEIQAADEDRDNVGIALNYAYGDSISFTDDELSKLTTVDKSVSGAECNSILCSDTEERASWVSEPISKYVEADNTVYVLRVAVVGGKYVQLVQG